MLDDVIFYIFKHIRKHSETSVSPPRIFSEKMDKNLLSFFLHVRSYGGSFILEFGVLRMTTEENAIFFFFSFYRRKQFLLYHKQKIEAWVARICNIKGMFWISSMVVGPKTRF